MESKTNRYQSRILREMHQHTENPFNSPPSSTGSHGTVTLTSNITMGPQGESTRRMDKDSINLPNNPTTRSSRTSQQRHQPSFNINTSALGRTFPEWSRWSSNDPESKKDAWEKASDSAPNRTGKENVTPRGSPDPSILASPKAYESGRDKVEASKSSNTPKDKAAAANRGAHRTRAQMQPRVQTESECSSDLSEHLVQPLPNLEERREHPRVPTPISAKSSKPRRGNVTALLETLKTAQTKQAESQEQSAKHVSPKPQPLVQPRNAAKIHMERQSGMSNLASPGTPNQTARSFFLPNLSHMNDFLSGALRLSTFRNGIPVFVKHGRVHDRESMDSPDHHVDVEAIAIPEDEEKIFVSLDKIKDEVHALKEHDELVSKQAEHLQVEIEDLHVQIAKYRSRKDSAMGSDSESSIIDHLNAQKSQLEDQVSSLQARLDKANRKVSISEIHTESYVAERDEALKSATEHLDKIKRLQSELNQAQNQLETLYDNNAQNTVTLELENKSLRKDNNSIRQQWKSLLEENQSLRSHNDHISQKNVDFEHDLKAAKTQLELDKAEFETVQQEYDVLLEEKTALKQDNLSLERQNDKLFNDNKILKQQNSLLDRRTNDLQNDVARLQKLLDAAGAETGTMPVDLKDIKYRLEVQNRKLSRENAELQQQIIDLQADYSTKRANSDQEKRRLGAVNARLKEQINQMNSQFEQIVKESKEEAAKYEEQQVTFTQKLELIADKESALAEKLRKTADHEAALQSELERKTDAITEARQITQEIKDFLNTVSKKKQEKTTGTVESKGKSVVSETTARSTASQTDMAAQEDYTQQINLTQGSDYASIFTQGEMPKLRDALRQVRSETQQEDLIEDSFELYDDGMDGPLSPSLPPMFPPPDSPRSVNSYRVVSTSSKEPAPITKPQPIGILKDTQLSRLNAERKKSAHAIMESLRLLDKPADSGPSVRKSKSDDTAARKVSFGRPGLQSDAAKALTDRSAKDARPAFETDFTGRFSVKSGVSGMSVPSEVSNVDSIHRRNAESARFDVDSDHEENMTSGLFMDDITLGQQKTAEKAKAKKSNKGELSKDAKRVLDNLCHDHDCRNCVVCARINSHRCGDHHGDHYVDGGAGKKSIRVPRPTRVTERPRNSGRARYEDESTLRPSQEPEDALVKVITSLMAEEKHLRDSLRNKDNMYNDHDPSVNRRIWKSLSEEIDQLRRARDLKRDQIYYLFDALEGVRRSGKDMTMEFVEVTIHNAMSKDETWNGVVDLGDN
ncbi:hypothetical protein GGR54DRAFT_445342 [Hypoxylon sp. NC1633]|nr:hypothetical protein GGR54DRAFT_445342 [Hypoxylon sp. NC1633]